MQQNIFEQTYFGGWACAHGMRLLTTKEKNTLRMSKVLKYYNCADAEKWVEKILKQGKKKGKKNEWNYMKMNAKWAANTKWSRTQHFATIDRRLHIELFGWSSLPQSNSKTSELTSHSESSEQMKQTKKKKMAFNKTLGF